MHAFAWDAGRPCLLTKGLAWGRRLLPARLFHPGFISDLLEGYCQKKCGRFPLVGSSGSWKTICFLISSAKHTQAGPDGCNPAAPENFPLDFTSRTGVLAFCSPLELGSGQVR